MPDGSVEIRLSKLSAAIISTVASALLIGSITVVSNNRDSVNEMKKDLNILDVRQDRLQRQSTRHERSISRNRQDIAIIKNRLEMGIQDADWRPPLEIMDKPGEKRRMADRDKLMEAS